MGFSTKIKKNKKTLSSPKTSPFKLRPPVPSHSNASGRNESIKRVSSRRFRKAAISKDRGLLYHPLGKEIKRNALVGMKVSPQGPIPLLTILQNKLMRDGRKGPAEKIFFRALRELNEYSNEKSGVTLFYTALERLKPALTTVTRRVGRNYYQVPVPLRSFTPYKLAFQ
jgi:hypothetical protein